MRRVALMVGLAALLALGLLFPRPFSSVTAENDLPPLLLTPAAVRPAPENRIDLNTATAEQLQTLPGIGPVRAQAILDYRAQHGAFRRVEELAAVKGIGSAVVESLRELVFVSGAEQ